jgi:hypothetical protein
MKFILLTLVGVWIIVLAILTIPDLLAVSKETKSAERVFDEYADASVRGDYDEAYENCATDFCAQLSAGNFSDQQKELRNRFGQLLSIKRQGMRVSRTGDPASPTTSRQRRSQSFLQASRGTIQILAKANKANESKVIARLKASFP